MVRQILYVMVACGFLIACKNNTVISDKWGEIYKTACSNQDYHTAIVALNHLIITDSANRPAYYDSLVVFYSKKTGNFMAGRKFMEKGLLLNPDNAHLLEYKCIFLTGEGKLEEARAIIQRAYKITGLQRHLYMYASTFGNEKKFDEYNKIVNDILYGNAKQENVEVQVSAEDNIFQMVDIKALCYLDRAKISKDPNEVLIYIDSALALSPDYQEALYIKNQILKGGK